jgi:hypothetical protein
MCACLLFWFSGFLASSVVCGDWAVCDHHWASKEIDSGRLRKMSTAFLWQQRVAWCHNFLLQGVSPGIVGGKSLVLGQEKGIQALAASQEQLFSMWVQKKVHVWQQHFGNRHPVIYSMQGVRSNRYFEITMSIHYWSLCPLIGIDQFGLFPQLC